MKTDYSVWISTELLFFLNYKYNQCPYTLNYVKITARMINWNLLLNYYWGQSYTIWIAALLKALLKDFYY